MGCNCKVTDSILAIVVIVFALWPNLIGSAAVGKWILVIAGVLMLLHAQGCKAKCAMPAPAAVKAPLKKSVAKKKKR